MYKSIIFILSILILQACNAQQKNAKPENKDPLYQQKLAAFNKQKHRLEIDECEIRYNGKSFSLEDSIEGIVDIFGNNYDKSVGKFSSKLIYIWKEIGVKVRLKKTEKNIEFFSFNLIKTSQKLSFCDVFIDKNTLMQEFVNNSSYSFNDFLIGNHSYELISEECKEPQKFYISSDVPWIYDGSGHLQTKEKIDYTKTKKIEAIEISFVKKK